MWSRLFDCLVGGYFCHVGGALACAGRRERQLPAAAYGFSVSPIVIYFFLGVRLRAPFLFAL